MRCTSRATLDMTVMARDAPAEYGHTRGTREASLVVETHTGLEKTYKVKVATAGES